jgi:acyl-CoA thioester hydrolase
MPDLKLSKTITYPEVPSGYHMQADAMAAGALVDGVHVFPVRVYYEDTDAGGIVFYANYLKYFERARTEVLRHFDISQQDILDRTGLAFAVRHCVVDYQAPARLDDLLHVATSVAAIKGARLTLQQMIYRHGLPLVGLSVTLVCLNAQGRATRLPDFIRNAMAHIQV